MKYILFLSLTLVLCNCNKIEKPIIRTCTAIRTDGSKFVFDTEKPMTNEEAKGYENSLINKGYISASCK